MTHARLATLVLLGGISIANTAAAAPTPTPAVLPVTTTGGLPAPDDAGPPLTATETPAERPAMPDPEASDRARARFSWKRLIVETMGSAVAGSLLSYAVYTGTCGDDACLGGALLAFGTNLAATPLIAYGIGELGGGNGSLGRTYLIGFSGAGMMLIQPPEVGLALTVAFLPLTSALGYELSSNAWAHEHDVQLNVAPVAGLGPTTRGGMATMSMRF